MIINAIMEYICEPQIAGTSLPVWLSVQSQPMHGPARGVKQVSPPTMRQCLSLTCLPGHGLASPPSSFSSPCFQLVVGVPSEPAYHNGEPTANHCFNFHSQAMF